MKKRFSVLVRLACLTMALLMAVTLFAGCKKSDGGNASKTSSKQTSSVKDTDVMSSMIAENKWDPNIPEEKDLGGFEFIFVAQSGDEYILPKKGESEDKDQIVEIIEDLQKRYNCKFSVSDPGDWIKGGIMERLLAGDEVGHVMLPHTWRAGTFVSAKTVLDWNTPQISQYVNMNELWWNDTMAYASNIDGKVYAGACNIQNYADWSYVMYFNKKILREVGSSEEELYKMYRDKTWTWDAFMELAKKATKDLNDDGVMDKNDQFGFVSSDYDAPVAFLTSADADSIRTQDGKTPKYTYGQAHELSVLMKLNEMYTISGAYFTDSMKQASTVTGTTYAYRKQFCDEKALFYPHILSLVRSEDFRNIQENVGIMPMPLGPTSSGGWQTDYRSRVEHNFWLCLIPATNKDLDETGLLLEALAFAHWKNTIERFETYGILYCSDDTAAEIISELYNWSTFEVSQFIYGYNNYEYDKLVCQPLKQVTTVPAFDCMGTFVSLEVAAQTIIDNYFSSVKNK